jgi:Flp pilus assembly protein TadG
MTMRNRPTGRPRGARAGASAVELALVLPLLAAFFLCTVDFARLYYHYTIVTNCARAGALYAADPTAAAESPFADYKAAALADAGDLTPSPTVTSSSGVDGDGNAYVEVTVSYSFPTVGGYPGLPNPINVARTVRARVAPTMPSQ